MKLLSSISHFVCKFQKDWMKNKNRIKTHVTPTLAKPTQHKSWLFYTLILYAYFKTATL